MPSSAAIPNDYALVREAIDRGVPLDEVKPGNKITAQLKKLMLDAARRQAEAGEKAAAPVKKFKLSVAHKRKQEQASDGRPFHSPTRCRARDRRSSKRRRRRARRRGLDARCRKCRPNRRRRCSRSRANPLLSDKLLDAKVRLHRRLIEEINLSALEKLPEEEIRTPRPATGRRNTCWPNGWRSTPRSSPNSSRKSSTR